MKFKICHDPERKALSIPRAALQISGLDGQDELHLHADDGCVLLLPERLKLRFNFASLLGYAVQKGRQLLVGVVWKRMLQIQTVQRLHYFL